MHRYPGVSQATKKNGDIYYRSSITVSGKHISLGSFISPSAASAAYRQACDILQQSCHTISTYSPDCALDFTKYVSLVNLRDCGLYFKTPIYLQKHYFYYYITPEQFFIFDREDLFFYATHTIQFRGGYYFVCDYGSQYSILSRYGIHSYARKGIDYLFVNGNEYDFRYENIRIINDYMGVSQIAHSGSSIYETVIHIHGNYIVGRYPDAITAAIAYNKAADLLEAHGIGKTYSRNYIHSYTSKQYQDAYARIHISDKILSYCDRSSEKRIED